MTARRKGDDNAPFFLRGVVSYGTSICGVGIPGAYSNVKHYKDWIIGHMRP